MCNVKMKVIEPDLEITELGPCSAHAVINCMQCYELDPEDLDGDGNLVVVDGQSVTDALRDKRFSGCWSAAYV